jgi:hypothetical protein
MSMAQFALFELPLDECFVEERKKREGLCKGKI